MGADGSPALGRGLDHGDVPQAGERHLQGARDGRGRQGQDVHLQLHLAQELLLLDAEALLLVHDQQAEVLRPDVAREQAVGADQDVHLPLRVALEDLPNLSGLPQPRDHLHVEGRVGEPLAERAEVLLGEDRGGHEHHHLLAVGRGLVRGSQRHLRLAVADVAADQAVHRPRLLHPGLDRVDRLHLVGRLAIWEGGLEGELELAVRSEGVAAPHLALGVEIEELARHRLRGAARPGLHVLPALPAERAELGLAAVGAEVPADPGELIRWREDPVAIAVLELQVVAGHPGEGLGVEAREARDAVVLVDDVVADAQLHGRRELGSCRHRGRRPPAVNQRPLRDDGELQFGSEKALPNASLGEGDARPLRHLVAQEGRVDAVQVVSGPLRLAPALEADHRSVFRADQLLELGLCLRERAGGELRAPRPERVLLAGVGAEGEVRPLSQWPGHVHVELAGLVLVDRRAHVLPVVVERARNLLRRGDRDQGIVRNEIEGRQEAARIDVLAVLGGELGRRRELDPVRVAERALGEDREPPQRLDLVAEQLDPHGALLGRRIDVEDVAADRELAALLDLVRPLVAGVRQQLGHVFQIDRLALMEDEAVGPELGIGNGLRQGDRARDDHRGPRSGRQSIESSDSETGQMGRWLHVRVVGGPARRVEVNRAGRQKGMKIRGEVASRPVVRGDDQDRTIAGSPRGLDQSGEEVGTEGRRDVGLDCALPRRQGIAKRPETGVICGDVE